MVLIFGGAYQGKLDYTLERFGISKDDVHFCNDTDIHMPKGIIAVYEIDKWILALIKENADVPESVKQFIAENTDAIVICNDISGGIVPIDATFRKWREAVGRAMGQLAQNSDEVVRMFCGIPTTLKSGEWPKRGDKHRDQLRCKGVVHSSHGVYPRASATPKIHLIRHGKTLANEQKLYCGATDLPLSDAGIAEILDLKNQGLYPKYTDFYFTSGLVRTEQTLDLLYGSVPRVAIPQLAEFNFGSFEMKNYEILKEQDDYQAWITDESGNVSCPGGDNRQNFTIRVLDGLETLVEKWQGDLFVVCHGGVIVSVMEHLFPNTKNFYEWQPQPGRGYSIALGGPKLYQPI